MGPWRRFIFFLVTALLLGFAGPLFAQTASAGRRAFLDVSFSPDRDDTYSSSGHIAGVTLGTGASVGFGSERRGVEFDVVVPQWHARSSTYKYQYVGQSTGYQLQNHFYESVLDERHRSVHFAVLHRRSLPVNERFSIAWLVGGAFVYRPNDQTSVTSEVRGDGTLMEVNRFYRASSRNYFGAVGGLDVQLKMSTRWSLVPRLRVTAFPSLLDDSGSAPTAVVARPELGIRGRF